SATASKFSKLAYALSADTSPMVKDRAVSLTSGTNCGESAASLSRMRTAATQLVRTPDATWHLTQTCRIFVTPYLWSYHLSNLLVEKPLESMAKSFSMTRSGAALLAIIALRIGVRVASSMKAVVLTPGIAFEMWPRRWASRRSDEKRRLPNVL